MSTLALAVRKPWITDRKTAGRSPMHCKGCGDLVNAWRRTRCPYCDTPLVRVFRQRGESYARWRVRMRKSPVNE